MPKRPEAVLLDRDGTINVKADEGNYITDPEDLILLPGAAHAIRALNEARVPVAVVTNQRGIARGHMTERDLADVHSRLRELLREDGASVDAILYCPHDKGVCPCRKPGILLLRRAQAAFGLSTLRNSVMVGDSPSDVLAGQRVGARSILLTAGHPAAPRGVELARSLREAVDDVLFPRPVSLTRAQSG